MGLGAVYKAGDLKTEIFVENLNLNYYRIYRIILQKMKV